MKKEVKSELNWLRKKNTATQEANRQKRLGPTADQGGKDRKLKRSGSLGRHTRGTASAMLQRSHSLSHEGYRSATWHGDGKPRGEPQSSPLSPTT